MKPLKAVLITTIGACLMAGFEAGLRCEPHSAIGDQIIHEMFAESDLVIIGSVEKTQVLREWARPELGHSSPLSVPMQSVSSAVRVEKTYKGSSDNTVEIQFDIQAPPVTSNQGLALFHGERALLFLKVDGDGNYHFVDGSWGKFNAEGLSLAGYDVGPDALEQDLSRSLNGGKTGQASAMNILLGYRGLSSNSESTLSKLTAESDPHVVAQALAILLATGEPKYFGTALRFLRTHGDSVNARELVLLSGRIREFGVHADPPTMAAMSRLPLFSIQYAALDVLAEMKSAATVESVIHNLDDPNPFIQYQSLYVLRNIVDEPGERRGPEYSPSKPEFDKDPSYYTGLWKTWWETEGKLKFPQGTPEPH